MTIQIFNSDIGRITMQGLKELKGYHRFFQYADTKEDKQLKREQQKALKIVIELLNDMELEVFSND